MGVQLLNSLVAVLMGVALLWVDVALLNELCVVCFNFFLAGSFNCRMANGNISTVIFSFASAETICRNGSQMAPENEEAILALHFAPPAGDEN